VETKQGRKKRKRDPAVVGAKKSSTYGPIRDRKEKGSSKGKGRPGIAIFSALKPRLPPKGLPRCLAGREKKKGTEGERGLCWIKAGTWIDERA